MGQKCPYLAKYASFGPNLAIWQLFLAVARTLFFGPKISVFGQKIQFLPYDPNFGHWPICSPRSDGSFPTWESIFRLFVLNFEALWQTDCEYCHCLKYCTLNIWWYAVKSQNAKSFNVADFFIFFPMKEKLHFGFEGIWIVPPFLPLFQKPETNPGSIQLCSRICKATCW